MVFEFAQSLIFSNPLEAYTAVIATLGVAFWIVDRRSMKAALKADTESKVAAFRLERQKTEASVERSFASLQMKCETTRGAWDRHGLRNGPILSTIPRFSNEKREISRIKKAGKLVVAQFKESAPKIDSSEIEELEAYFIAANRTSLELAKLASQLPEPISLYH